MEWMTLLQIYGGAIAMVVISIAYFAADRSGSPFALRALSSAHGFVAALLFAGAVVIGIAGATRPAYALPFQLLHMVPAILVGLSLILYRGPKLLHVLQVPNVIAMLWSVFIGTMAVTGDWL
jgi:hypothetical protein